MREITEAEIEKLGLNVDYNSVSTFNDPSDVKLVLIEIGDVLWRFVSRKNQPKYGKYWVDKETMSGLMSIFWSWNAFSMPIKKEVIRDNMAILNDWNNLSWRMKVEFRKPVVALYGTIGAQKLFGDDVSIKYNGNRVFKAMEYRIGGFKQYVIPYFENLNDFEGEKVAPISHFAHL